MVLAIVVKSQVTRSYVACIPLSVLVLSSFLAPYFLAISTVPFSHSFSKYLLSIYYGLGTGFRAGVTAITR